MIEVDWVKSAGHKKAYKHEVPIKIRQKARFEKNYIVWKHFVAICFNDACDIVFNVNTLSKFCFKKCLRRTYIVWKHKASLRRTI
jgi:hypothetical protein